MSVLSRNRLPKKIPLLIVLVTSFVTLNVLAVGLVGYLSFRNGQRAVNDVARQLRSEITTRIKEHLYTFLTTPQQINQANADILRQGVLAADDAVALERHFWGQIRIFDSVSSIYFGNPDGGLVDAGREGAGGSLYVIATDGFKSGPFKKYATDSRGQRTDLLVTVPDFDARTRPWYNGAVSKDNAVWSAAYILFTGQDMSIAASRPVYNKRQELLGVVSVDLFLSQLGSFLQNLEIGETGQGFVMERSGLLVASSADEKPFTELGTDEPQRRLYASESTVPLIRYATEALAAQFGDYRNITGEQQLEFDVNGQRQFLQVSPIENEDGLDWLIVVVIPEADFMAQISANNRTTIFLIIITLGIAVVVSVVTTRRIIGPILQLNAFAHELSKGQWGRPIGHDSRISEISSLTQSLNHMAGQLQQMVAELITEVAERKQTAEALRESEENLRTTFNSIGDAVITADVTGKVTGMNPVAETLTGWGQAEALGKPLTEVFHIINDQTREPVQNPVDKVLKAGKVVGLANHTALIARDGAEYQIADSGAPIQNATGRITGVVLVFRNVTEQLRAEQELLKAKKLESVGVLAGGIAHDFNNLLTGLFGNIELAKMFLPTGHKSHQFLESAGRSMESATNLTNQLLTFAKGSDPIKETIFIGAVITDTARFSLRGSSVKLQTDIAPDLWPVEADKGQLSQVISNLVINAQQAMPTGGTITLAAKNVEIATGKYVQINVQDEGTGIAPQYLDQIFDPYFSTKQTGSGLGLASTHSIISKHNGTITVKSQLHRGTTFTIHLPAAAEKEATAAGEFSAEMPVAPVFSARILVMDDEEVVREVIGAMLEKLGHTVIFAVDGQEAVSKYQTSSENGMSYDVVITDLTIPGGMGGQEAAQEILRIDAQAKIIVSSGYATDPVMANYREYGFKGIVVKPYRFADLKKVIQQILKLR